MDDICNFLPKRSSSGDIEYYHFVYEANFKKLKQPFFFMKYGAYLVYKGCGVLKTKTDEYKLNPGTLFFTFPSSLLQLKAENNFTYLYITFDGDGALSLLDTFGISEDNFVFDGMEQLTTFWMSSIRRITPLNATALTESVLLYSLSFIGDNEKPTQNTNRFDSILSYLNQNFSDPSLSVRKVADLFFYSEKYLSSLFIKSTGVKFTEYLNRLRISHAVSIIDSATPIAEIAMQCGFSDPLYFSKVFKKAMCISPSEYVKTR